jgi:hypothetical protein
MAKHLGLNLQAISDPDGTINESKCTVEDPLIMLSFSSHNPFPANALQGAAAIDAGIRKLQK